jgi:hypothetical protein
MKFLNRINVFILALFLMWKTLNINGSDELSELVAATNFFITEAFRNEKIVNLIFPDTKSFSINDFKDKLLVVNLKNAQHLFHQDYSSLSLKRSEIKKNCLILLINTYTEFIEINQIITPKNVKLSGQFLIVSIGDKLSKFESIFRILWAKQIHNVNIMFKDKISKRILMKTFLPFSDGNCSNTKPILINEFLSGKFTSKELFPDKMK